MSSRKDYPVGTEINGDWQTVRPVRSSSFYISLTPGLGLYLRPLDDPGLYQPTRDRLGNQ